MAIISQTNISTFRDSSTGIHTVISIDYPTLQATGKSLYDAVDALKKLVEGVDPLSDNYSVAIAMSVREDEMQNAGAKQR